MNDFTIPDLAIMPDRPSDWMKAKLADALVRDESIAALVHLARTGDTTLTVSVDFSQARTVEEDYTCDKCRTHHPAGLNVALTAFGKDTAFAQITVTNPMDLFAWAAVIVQVGLCHTCWAEEGYPPSSLADLDEGFVQQAVRLMEAPDLLNVEDWKVDHEDSR